MEWKESKRNVEVQLKNMHPNKKNPRKKYGKKELGELKMSLESMGQLTNCILDEKGTILTGHRRHFAANEMNWETLKCDIKCGLSEFNKSAVMISSNSTNVHFNLWEHREAISRIYWNEFLEEFVPSGKDKGYTAFAKKMGMSSSYARRIIESAHGKNKKYLEKLKKEEVGSDVIDNILSSPKHLRGYLTGVAIKKQKEVKGMGKQSRVQAYVRAVKRKTLLEESDKIDKRKFRIWTQQLEEIGFELGDYIIEKGNYDDLKNLELVIKKNIITFYNKLVQNNK